MRKIIFFYCVVVLLLTQPFSLTAQREFPIDPVLYQKIQDSVYANAPYIFEAEHLKYKNVGLNGWNELVELVRVRRSYRGDVRVGDTLEVWFHDQRRNDGAGVKPIRNLHFNPNHNYVQGSDDGHLRVFFFCKKTDNTKVFPSATKILRYITEVPVSRIVEYDYRPDSIIIEGFTTLKITSVQQFEKEVLDKIQKAETAKIILPPTSSKQEKPKSKKRKRLFGDAKSMLLPVGLEVYAANYTIGGGYYEFDVMAKALSATYPNNISFLMTYNPAYFCNTCTAVSDFVTPTLDAAFQGTVLAGGVQRTKYALQSYWEVYQQKVGINLQLNDYSQYGTVSYARPLVATTPQKLMHIKLKLLNPSLTCVPNAGTFSLGLSSYFTTTTNAAYTAINPYTITFPNSAVFRSNSAIPCAAPIITSFSPSALRAGAGDTLTIIGNNFGTYGVKSAVQFRNAENPYNTDGTDVYIQNMPGIDTIMWSNTMIKIRVPSYYTDTIQSAVGTGKIKVRRNIDQATSTPSANMLHIKSNFKQADVPNRPYWSGKGYARLTNRNCRKSYVVRCHKDVSTEKRAYIHTAAKEWNRRLGYTIFEMDKTTTTSTISSSDTCIIAQENTPDPNVGDYIVATSSSLDYARLKVHPDSLAIANKGFGMTIALNALDGSSNNFIYDSLGTVTKYRNQTDFYGVMLHEFGHALGLGHALDPLNTSPNYKDAELMHYRINFSDTLAPTQRKTLTSSGGESLQGVQNILQRSQNTQWNTATSGFGTIGTTYTPINIVSSKVVLCNYQQGWVELKAVPTASYSWQWLPLGQTIWDAIPTNNANFIGSTTNKLLINYNSGFNPNGYKIRCMVNHNGCDRIGGVNGANWITATENTILAAQGAILKPIPTVCRPTTTTFALETNATPANGVYKLYTLAGIEIANAFNPNASPNLTFTNVPIGRYEVRYDAGTSNACGVSAIAKKDLNVLATTACADTNLVVKINSVYQGNYYSNTNTIRIGICEPMTTDPFVVHYTITGKKIVGDSVKVQLSNSAGVFANGFTNNANVLVRKKYLTASNARFTDSLTTSLPLTTAEGSYKLRLIYKKAGNSIVKYDTLRNSIVVFLVPQTPKCAIPSITPENRLNHTPKIIASENIADNWITVYPNPNNGLFKVILPQIYAHDGAITRLNILNLMGQVVAELSTEQSEIDWNLQTMPTGVYFVRVEHLDKTSVQKIIIAH